MVTVFLNLVLSIGWLGRTGDKGKASLLQRAVWHAQKRRVLESRMLSYVYLREHAQLTYQATSSSSNCCELNLSWNTIRAKTKKGQTKCSFFTGQLFICGYICRLLLLKAFPIYSFQGSFFYSDNSRYNTPNICVLSDNFRTTVCRSSWKELSYTSSSRSKPTSLGGFFCFQKYGDKQINTKIFWGAGSNWNKKGRTGCLVYVTLTWHGSLTSGDLMSITFV